MRTSHLPDFRPSPRLRALAARPRPLLDPRRSLARSGGLLERRYDRPDSARGRAGHHLDGRLLQRLGRAGRPPRSALTACGPLCRRISWHRFLIRQTLRMISFSLALPPPGDCDARRLAAVTRDALEREDITVRPVTPALAGQVSSASAVRAAIDWVASWVGSSPGMNARVTFSRWHGPPSGPVRGGAMTTYRRSLRASFARAAPMAVFTSFSSSGGGRTAGIPRVSIHNSRDQPAVW